MSTKNGIDVSKYQGSIDFKKVKAAGIDFVIIKAGYGRLASQRDPNFETNYKNAKNAGLDVGAYWYSYAVSAEDVKKEAAACLEVIKGKKFEYPIYFDLEEKSQFAKGKSFCTGLVKAFCGEIEKAGYFTGLYISRSPLQQYIASDTAKKYALWIAEYNSSCNYSGSYGIWQYTSSGRVNGISGNVDRDHCYVDYPSAIKKAGLNGYPKQTTTAAKTLDTDGFKKGDKGDGVLALKCLLKLSGVKGLDSTGGFGGGTQNAVNGLLKKWGYKQNGVAGDKFIAKLYKSIK